MAPHGMGDGFGNAGFARARRADKTEDRAFDVLLFLANGQIFHYALFHLFQPVMLFIQNALGIGQIKVVLGAHAPGQIQNRFDIGLRNRRLRRALRKMHQARQLFAHLFPGLGAKARFIRLLAKRVYFFGGILLAKLGLDGLDLLSEVIFFLRFIHRNAHALMDFSLHIQQFDFAAEHTEQQLHPRIHVDGFQNILPLIHMHQRFHRHFIRQLPGLFNFVDDGAHLGRHLAGEHGIVLRHLHQHAHGSFLLGIGRRLLPGGQLLHLHAHIGLRAFHLRDFRTVQPLHQHSDMIARQSQHLLHFAHGSDSI